MKKFIYLMSALFVISLLYSCEKKSEVTDNGGGILKAGIESNPTNLDPRFATDANSSKIGRLIFNGLVTLDKDSKPVPDLAERWEVKDNTNYVFYLKKGIKFHDGQEFTARDVEKTFQSVLDPAMVSPFQQSYEIIDKIEIIDDHTISFMLKRPHAPFIVDMVLPVIPAKFIKDPDFSKKLIGTGAFKFKSFIPDDYVELKANKDYFDGSPKIDGVLFKIIPEDNVRILEIRKGSLDILLNNVSPDLLPLLEKDENLQIIKGKGLNYTYIGFNMQDPLLSDIRVRKAIAYGIDRKSILKEVLRGEADPATGLLSPSNWAYSGDVKIYNHDPEEAKRLLDEAGYKDKDGNGPQPRFKLNFKTSQNELANRIAEVFQAQLKDIGIDVEINRYEWGTFYSFIKAGNFQIYTLTWVGVAEPDIYYSVFHTGSIPPAGGNRGRYSNKELDLLLEKGRITVDTAERKKIYEEIQKTAALELPYVSLWYPVNIAVMKKELKNFELYPSGSFASFSKVEFKK